jgi:hypothetical protein
MVVPVDVIVSINRYVERGIPTGGFLQAVIDNDLAKACGKADQNNMQILPAIVAYLYNECPSGCWGRSGAFMDWIERKFYEKEENQK